MASETDISYHRAKCENFARVVAQIVREHVPAYDVTLEYYVITATNQPWTRVSIAAADGGFLTAQDIEGLQKVWQEQNGQPDQTIVGPAGEFEVV